MISAIHARWRTLIVILALILVLQLLIGATVAGAASPVYHVVQWGENLTSIAYMYGTSAWDIAQANGIWNPDLIYVGQVLYIPYPGRCGAPCGTPVYVPRPVPAPCPAPCGTPVYVPRPVPAPCPAPCGTPVYVPRPVPVPQPCYGPCGTVYVVQPGDTLTWIAMRFGTTVWAIAQANGLSNPNVIYVGQRLIIPV